MRAKRRVATAPRATGEAAASSRSTTHPGGPCSSRPSSLIAESPAFHTVASIWSRSPPTTMPSSATPSSDTPAAVASAASSGARCAVSAGALPSACSARASSGTIAAGCDGLRSARAVSTSAT
ncbi:MAG: hypothetical protein DMD47_00205 [Gemmatimonadetes bacterium]|nr:MAG: hypothetical protein DMD47_00205 [Gemmatimonadota bacterium]